MNSLQAALKVMTRRRTNPDRQKGSTVAQLLILVGLLLLLITVVASIADGIAYLGIGLFAVLFLLAGLVLRQMHIGNQRRERETDLLRETLRDQR